MRLVDLLLVLLFEGRKALPKSSAGSTGRIPGLRRLDSSGERSHRQLIDCIRSKDTDALIDAIDTGGKQKCSEKKNLINKVSFYNLWCLNKCLGGTLKIFIYMFTYFVKYTTGLASNNSSVATFFLIAIKGINASLELFGMLNFF